MSVSKKGYSDKSPYKNRKSLLINSPQGLIDMNNTGRFLMGIDETGFSKLLLPYSGLHQFPGKKITELPLAQQGGRTPIYVNNPNDPRLRAYNDSLNLYKASEENRQWLLSNPNIKKPIYNSAYPALSINGKIQPTGSYEGDVVNTVGVNVNKYAFNKYKKPVQPVIYQKEQKDYPIVTRPGAQVRGTITPGQMTRDTTQDGVPIYGPANSTIGYWNNGEFSPYTGVNQRGTVNNPDTELMQNSEALKKYLRGKGLNFKKGGLTPNKARQILHDGTVHGEPMTEKQRRFFGAKSKGHTNFRK